MGRIISPELDTARAGVERRLAVRHNSDITVKFIDNSEYAPALAHIDSFCFPEDLAVCAEEFAELITGQDNSIGYIVKSGTWPVGYVLGADDKEDLPPEMHDGSFYMTGLAVLPCFRQGGIGKALHELLEVSARHFGARNLFLHATEEFTHLFAKLGYSRLAVVPDYYDPDRHALLMRKSLEGV